RRAGQHSTIAPAVARRTLMFPVNQPATYWRPFRRLLVLLPIGALAAMLVTLPAASLAGTDRGGRAASDHGHLVALANTAPNVPTSLTPVDGSFGDGSPRLTGVFSDPDPGATGVL